MDEAARVNAQLAQFAERRSAGKQSAPAENNIKMVRYVKSEKSCEAQTQTCRFRVAHRERLRDLCLKRV